MLMVSNLQHTLQRKQDAIKTLASKSMTLKKAIEPRGAYKYKPRENTEQGNSSPSQSQLSPLKSVNSGD